VPIDDDPLPFKVVRTNGGHWESPPCDRRDELQREDLGGRENLRLVQRWTRTDPDTLDDAVTVEDPTDSPSTAKPRPDCSRETGHASAPPPLAVPIKDGQVGHALRQSRT
jgi:hypothetical protein